MTPTVTHARTMPARHPHKRLTVATYNIHRCVGLDGRADPGRVLNVLRSLDADLIALQEIEWQPWDALDLLTDFGRQLGYRAVAGSTLLRQDGHYGNAILTRLPVLDVRRIDLTVPGREARGALGVAVDGGDGEVRIIATHLGLRPGERRHQMTQLLELLSREPIEPAILLGDLNEWFLWGRPLRWLHAYFGHTPAPATWPARFPLLALDRILVKPRTRLAGLTVHASGAARAASDHLPLRARIAV
jgi:endonuclease/exonuclease/phosphatase family metal-dependent hydrolase